MNLLIGIVVPSGALIHADTAACLIMNTTVLAQVGIPFMFINPKTSLVQKGRTVGVTQAIKNGCTHVMFVDSDMTFPSDTMLRLYQRGKDVVGCYCPKREEGGEIVGTVHNSSDLIRKFNSKDKGLMKAETLGCAVMMIRTDVFKRTNKPWFHVEMYEDDTCTSEDEWFCTHTPHDIWCDCDLSKEVGHIGTKTFRSN